MLHYNKHLTTMTKLKSMAIITLPNSKIKTPQRNIRSISQPFPGYTELTFKNIPKLLEGFIAYYNITPTKVVLLLPEPPKIKLILE